jgi:ribosomal protein L12E/L44/L45/RPP1/RPP2
VGKQRLMVRTPIEVQELDRHDHDELLSLSELETVLVAAASATVAAAGVRQDQDDRRGDQNCQDKADDQPAVV